MLQENAHIPLINEWLAPGQDDRQVLIAEVMIETFYPFVHWITAVRLKVEQNQLVGVFDEIGILFDALKGA
jgi:hypothetical protein